MYLLEYRDSQIPLAGGERFSIPPNVRLLGTLNTADRSIALVDHALRRRFAFLELYPSYEILEKFHEGKPFRVEGLVETLKQVNTQIEDRHYHVGISFFLRDDLEEQIEDIWRMEIEPYLDEYFFDQRAKAEKFRWDGVRKDVLGQP
jgi:5-methylcytosine-specific restriction protein B